MEEDSAVTPVQLIDGHGTPASHDALWARAATRKALENHGDLLTLFVVHAGRSWHPSPLRRT
jgi:hypothetical protein